MNTRRAPKEVRHGDQSLWSAVILQALEDATMPLPASCFKDGKAIGSRVMERYQGRAWFNIGNSDFIEVCNLAGLDPEAVITRALAMFKRCDEAEAKGERFALQPAKPEAKAPAPAEKVYEAHGKRMTLAQWADALGVQKNTLANRIAAGRHSLEDILSKDFKPLPRYGFNTRPPGRKAQLYTVNGVSHSVETWATIKGININTLRKRLRNGWSMEQALTLGRNGRGMVSDFKPLKGTGAGSDAQERTEIEISESSRQ